MLIPFYLVAYILPAKALNFNPQTGQTEKITAEDAENTENI